MRFYMRLAGLAIAIFMVVSLIQMPMVNSYVHNVKETSSLPDHQPPEETKHWQAKIKKEASKRTEQPINARVDPVWKGIPGYNGRIVDEKATLIKTLEHKEKKQIQWVEQEVKPKVTLDDLGNVPFYRGNPKKPAAALMVNVAWGTEHLDTILAILKQEKIKATFFLDGSWLEDHPAEAKKLKKAGHEIGNHAYSHPLMSQISQERIKKEIGKTEDLIKQTLHLNSRWFAPPAGDYNQQVVDIAGKSKLHTVLWTVDTIDWKKTTSPQMMTSRVEKQLGNGSLLLTHPTDRTVKALPEMIRIGKRKGLKWGTVSEVMSSGRINRIE